MSQYLLKDYLDFVARCYDSWPANRKKLFFRGQADKDRELLPAALRPDKNGLRPQERELILDFKQVSVSDMDYRGKIENILVEMQHFGMPTRLLDWSLSPLVALYFACTSDKDTDSGKEKDGKVFALNPWVAYKNIVTKLDYHPELMDILKEIRMLLAQKWSFDNISKYIEKKYGYSIDKDALRAPIPFVGRYMVDRVVSQQGCFVMWGDGDNQTFAPETYLPLQKFSEYEDALMSPFIIPGDSKESMRIHLRQLGVDRFMIFPDNEGIRTQVQEVKSIFNYR